MSSIPPMMILPGQSMFQRNPPLLLGVFLERDELLLEELLREPPLRVLLRVPPRVFLRLAVELFFLVIAQMFLRPL